MILLWLFKIGSVLRNAASFIAEHWKAFLILAICCYAFFYKTAYEREKAAYVAHILSDAKAAEIRRAENKLLRKQAEIEMADVIAKHKQQLADEKLDRKRVEDKLKGSINEISDALNIYRDAISLRNKSNLAERLPKMAENTAGLTETERNCYAYLETVVDACKVTDYDYEALYNLYNKQCQIYGCE